MLASLPGRFPLLRTVFADGGYAGDAGGVGRWRLRIVKRTDKISKFIVPPKRWIVERTFGWLGRCRRSSKDCEQDTQSGQTMIHLMLHRLAPG